MTSAPSRGSSALSGWVRSRTWRTVLGQRMSVVVRTVSLGVVLVTLPEARP